MAPTFADIAGSQYILLTTFTKDGRPKPTPIWAAPGGNGLLVITQEKSWKVKRIRNTPRVTIAKCDMRGIVKGEAVEATATILDKSRTGDAFVAGGRDRVDSAGPATTTAGPTSRSRRGARRAAAGTQHSKTEHTGDDPARSTIRGVHAASQPGVREVSRRTR